MGLNRVLISLACAVLMMSTQLVRAQSITPQTASLNQLLETHRARYAMPGLAAVVIKGTNIIAAGAAGVRKSGSPEKLTVEDKFHIGSNTKAMTATLAAMLVEQGKLAWTTNLASVFPDWAKEMDPAFREVTLEQLLSHRSGAPANSNILPIGDIKAQRIRYAKAVISRPPQHKPGSKYQYSNAGYIIAGAMIERVTGKPWEDSIRELLFKPLGMDSAGFGPPSAKDKADQPWGHKRQGDSFKPYHADNPAYLGPAGTVHCTLADYARFCVLHMQKKRILQGSTFDKLQTPFLQEYALGWVVTKRPWAGGIALTHSGSNTMNYFTAWLAPKKDFAVIVATNTGDDPVGGQVDSVIGELIGQYVNK